MYISNRTFDEIEIGDSACLERTLTTRDIELFAIASGDINPMHVDPQFAENTMFHGVIAHGMWGGALISNLLGTELPGPGTIYLNQTLKFINPIVPGDKVTASVTVINKKPGKNIVELECKCLINQDKLAISGNAIVLAPTQKVTREKIIMPKIKLETDESLIQQ